MSRIVSYVDILQPVSKKVFGFRTWAHSLSKAITGIHLRSQRNFITPTLVLSCLASLLVQLDLIFESYTPLCVCCIFCSLQSNG